jgi:hypothetical protein
MRTTPPGYFTVRWGLPEYTDWIDESMSWVDEEMKEYFREFKAAMPWTSHAISGASCTPTRS